MNEVDYQAILDEAFNGLGRDMKARAELDVAISKRRQFINATINMLNDEDRVFFMAKLDDMASDEERRTGSLKDAILRILRAEPRKWFSATAMRDRLLNAGFDFRGYTANPLASVSTTLQRMSGNTKEAVKTTVEGVAAYQLRKGIKRASRIKESTR